MATPTITTFVNGGYWLSSTAGQLPSSNIDATLYTHLFCGYAGIDSQNYEVFIPFGEYNIINTFSSVVRLSNPNVKTLLSISGPKEVFSEMARDPATRETFIQSSIKGVVTGEFNGLDLRWLYPSSQEDMQNFEFLINESRQAAEDDAKNNTRPPWILVASVSNSPYVQHNVEYPSEAIRQYLDWVNLISYDFYTPILSPNYTGPSSAFFNRKANSLSTRFGIDSWKQSLANLPLQQIVFGIPFHGWAWSLANPLQHDVFSKANGPAASTGESDYVITPEGKIDYYDVKNFMDETHAQNVPNDFKFLIAYTFADTTWITYESEDTISEKISFAKSMMALGYFASNIAADDQLNTLGNAAKFSWN